MLAFLVHYIAEKLGQDSLITGHFGIAREVININDEVAVAVSGVPDDVEVEEVQLHGAPQPPCDLHHEAVGGHLGVVEVHQTVIRVAVVGVVHHVVVVVGEIGDLGERHEVLRNGVGDVGEGLALDAPDVVADDVDLEDDAAVVDELLEDDGGLELVEGAVAEHEGHLVGLGAAVGDERLRYDGELEGLPGLRVEEGLPVVDDDLLWDPEGLVVGGIDPHLRHHLQHRNPVVEALNRRRRVQHHRIGVARRELLQLQLPVLAVKLVEDAVEGALIRQPPLRVHPDEVDPPQPRQLDQRVPDEAALLLWRQRVSYVESLLLLLLLLRH